MNKLTILFLTMLLTCLPMAMRAESHKEKRDDTRYLAGAVPVVDGSIFQGIPDSRNESEANLRHCHEVDERTSERKQ